jgi:hypothetical protein
MAKPEIKMAKNSKKLTGYLRHLVTNASASFGFEDGISQPLIKGIDDKCKLGKMDPETQPNMNTKAEVVIVGNSSNGHNKRPAWMNDGSFLVFRKLQQDVEAFEKLTDSFDSKFWKDAGCLSKEHMGAKLMGRWKSGKFLWSPLLPSAHSSTQVLRSSHIKQQTSRMQKRPRSSTISDTPTVVPVLSLRILERPILETMVAPSESLGTEFLMDPTT